MHTLLSSHLRFHVARLKKTQPGHFYFSVSFNEMGFVSLDSCSFQSPAMIKIARIERLLSIWHVINDEDRLAALRIEASQTIKNNHLIFFCFRCSSSVWCIAHSMKAVCILFDFNSLLDSLISNDVKFSRSFPVRLEAIYGHMCALFFLLNAKHTKPLTSIKMKDCIVRMGFRLFDFFQIKLICLNENQNHKYNL